MSYLALYRRYRPSGFDGLIGQEHIVKTLVNQIKTDRVGHAYLFCGARGTGKTSAAKIFARAINCLSPVNGSPCGKCEVCKALSDGANLDILEMDAASNNKVENVREIRDKIQYPPVAGRYKVYIIDEVHMLTTEAFNALLKTLEEPPAHAVFILATTEVHKLPSTILSRCMRFDFRLIPTKKIAELIAGIYDENGKEYDREAITAIAAAGAGSIRDALSVADICISYGEGKLTYRDVLEVLGATDIDVINKL
ncbi:MAG: DNA polymerase III subunit gamma/tau, partial [Clostridia bacterium]|nr:DNA polymerase III subunit gamma/tau [Clostridia bacterium]